MQKITKKKPQSIGGNFSEDFKKLVKDMLKKDATQRPSARRLLKFIKQKYPVIFKKVQDQFLKSQNLNFPIGEKGIFNFFYQMKLSDFLNEINFDTSDYDFEKPFRLVTSNFRKDICLLGRIFYQFNFKNHQLKLNGYLIKTSDDISQHRGN